MKVNELFDRYKTHDLATPKEKEVEKIESLEKLADVIKSNCKTILSAYKQSRMVLFRGMKNEHKDTFITGIRPDRKPVEMNGEVHEFLHKAFLELGLTATRKNSIFCSTVLKYASDWGTPYIIFPKDGWSATIFDIGKEDYSFYKLKTLAIPYFIDAWNTEEKYNLSDTAKVSALAKELERLDPQEITSAGEMIPFLQENWVDILVHGDSYIGVKISNTAITKKLLKLLDLKIKNI